MSDVNPAVEDDVLEIPVAACFEPLLHHRRYKGARGGAVPPSRISSLGV